MSFLVSNFNKLCLHDSSDDSISVIGLPNVKSHKLGANEFGYPMFFILCNEDSEKNIDGDLDLIRVRYSRHCILVNQDKKRSEGIYTIVELKTDSVEITSYFLDIIYLMITRLPSVLSIKQLRLEISKISNLFTRLMQPPIKTIQGLWAELFIIEQSRDPEYLINSWHINTNDKFDFNDGIDKLEVKSTSKNRRIHSFSVEQLNPNIMDLLTRINKRIKNIDLSFKLNEKVVECLGKDFEVAQNVYFDYQFSIDNLEFYRLSEIPRIQSIHVPKEISNLKFDCDLSNVQPIKNNTLKAKLHKALK
jgi:hypothetical protein